MARLGRPFGTDGKLWADSMSDDMDRFSESGTRFHWTKGTEDRFLIVETSRWMEAKSRWWFKFKEVSSREDAGELTGGLLSLPDESRQDLAEGRYYLDELTDLTVKAPDGRTVGTVLRVHDFTGNVVLEIRPANNPATFFFPFHDDFVASVDKKIALITTDRISELEGIDRAN